MPLVFSRSGCSYGGSDHDGKLVDSNGNNAGNLTVTLMDKFMTQTYRGIPLLFYTLLSPRKNKCAVYFSCNMVQFLLVLTTSHLGHSPFLMHHLD